MADSTGTIVFYPEFFRVTCNCLYGVILLLQSLPHTNSKYFVPKDGGAGLKGAKANVW